MSINMQSALSNKGWGRELYILDNLHENSTLAARQGCESSVAGFACENYKFELLNSESIRSKGVMQCYDKCYKEFII